MGAGSTTSWTGAPEEVLSSSRMLFPNGSESWVSRASVLLVGFLCLASSGNGVVFAEQTVQLETTVLHRYPHDPTSFTQGLLWWDGYLYESTGRYGRSALQKVELKSGKAVQKSPLSFRYFGEGLARVDDLLIQLTWMSQTAFVYDLSTFERVGELRYTGQGWGLTSDGNRLIMSDGSEYFTFRDAHSFEEIRRVRVTLEGEPVSLLNELEFAVGSVYANIWQSSQIVRINPTTGVVTAVIDTSSLPYQPRNSAEDVLNGIAYVPERETFLLTGKLWPEVFEVRFVTGSDGSKTEW